MKNMTLKKCAVGVLACMGFLTCAVAQEAATSPVAKTYGMSFKQAWEYGGWIMWVLAAISIFAMAMVFYFVIVLRAGAVTPREQIGRASCRERV